MSQFKLFQIKERLENTSYGRWKIYKNEDGVCIGTEEDHPQLKSPMPIITMATRVKEPQRQIWISDENAEFISHAKEDIEFLLAEVYKLQKLVD